MSKDARGRPRKKTNNSRPRRPKMTTREELEQYLSSHPESEYPWSKKFGKVQFKSQKKMHKNY